MLVKQAYAKFLVAKGLLIQLPPCRPAHMTMTLCRTVGNNGFRRCVATVHLDDGLVQLYIKA